MVQLNFLLDIEKMQDKYSQVQLDFGYGVHSLSMLALAIGKKGKRERGRNKKKVL